MYTRDDPHWVQAQSVVAATADGTYVNVKVQDEEFTNRHVEWHDPVMNKEKSDVLVQNSRGDWLRVWFFDKDIVPFKS